MTESNRELAWDTKRTAKALSLSVTWLEQLRIRGGGPPFIKVGKRVLYRPADVEKWFNDHAPGHTDLMVDPEEIDRFTEEFPPLG